MAPKMSLLTPILILFLGCGVLVCTWAARRWLKQIRGETQYTLTGVRVPLLVWPLALFSGLMLVGASLPGLLGQPMWLLDRVFQLTEWAFG